MRLIASINLTEAAGLTAATADLLPNGKVLPVSFAGGQILSIPVGNDGIMIYLGLGTQSALFGTAIPIRELSLLGKYVGGMFDLFLPFVVNKDVRGSAGLYTGPVGKNGIAFFVDASRALLPVVAAPSTVLGQLMTRSVRSTQMSAAVTSSPEIRFSAVNNSVGHRADMYDALDQLGNDLNGEPVNVGQ